MNEIEHPEMTPVVVEMDGSITDTVSWKKDELDTKTFVERLASSYNLDVIFQRDPVWSTEMKASLIHSMMNGTPIGNCLICEDQKNVAKKNVMDFKNRSLAIREFWNCKFSILLHLKKENGVVAKRMTWDEIQQSDDNQIINLRESFETYKIPCIIYKNMNLVKQSEKFITVNSNVPMQNEELLYGSNFWAKGFFNFVYKYCLDKLIKHTNAKQISKNEHQKGTVFAHRLMTICFGYAMDDVWGVRNIGISKLGKKNSKFNEGTKKFNGSLAKLIEDDNVFDWTDDSVKKIIEKTKYWDNIKTMKKCCESLCRIMEYKTSLKKKFLKNQLFDIVVFFMKKIEEGRLTFAMMENDQGIYYELITKYIEGKSSEMSGQSVTKNKIEARKKLFDNVWDECVKDDGVKNKKLTAQQISVAYMNAPREDPITGEIITDENATVDHVSPKSKFSDSDARVISKTSNRIKGNLTVENIAKLAKYSN